MSQEQIQIPKGWKVEKICNIFKSYSGGTPSRSNTEYWENGIVPWLRSGDLKNNHITKAEEFITEKGLKESSAKLWPKNSVVIALTGANTGRTGILDFECCGNQSIVGILPNEKIVPEFLWYYMQFSYNFFWKKTIGGAQPHINGKIVSEREFIFPENKETQKKIIQKLDDILVQLEEKKKEILKLQKSKIKLLQTGNEFIPFNNSISKLLKTLFQNILSEKFKELKKNHSLESISSLCDIMGGGTPSKSNSMFWNGDIPWVSPKDMKSYEIFDTINHITDKAIGESSTNLIPNNSILVVNRSGILARTLPIAINRVPVTLNQDMKSFIPKSNVLSDFIALFLISHENNILKNCLKRITTVHSLISEQFNALEIPIPKIREQELIVKKFYDKARMLSGFAESFKINSIKHEKTFQHINHIQSSILDAAFSGKLVQ